MKKLNYLLPVIVFTCILFGLCVKGITSADKTYSSAEKRELQTRPKMSAEAIRKGTFQEKYETYLSDQFPGRDMWVQLQTDASRLMGKSVSNGVYFGKDDYLLEHHTDAEFETKQERKNIKSLVELVKNIADDYSVHVMLVPTKTWTLQQKLPFCASTYDEQKMYDSLNEQLGNLADSVVVPVQETLCSHREEDIYYRTDHHWTPLGAFYAYTEFCNAKGIRANNILQYKKKTFKGFKGTFYRDTNNNKTLRADNIQTFYPLSGKKISMYYKTVQGQKIHAPLIDNVSRYGESLKYCAFISGDNPLTVIKNKAIKDGSSCVVVKESFGNVFVPYLADHYQNVYVIDYRYWSGKLSSFVQKKKVQDVILLNNISMTRNSYLVSKLGGIAG